MSHRRLFYRGGEEEGRGRGKGRGEGRKREGGMEGGEEEGRREGGEEEGVRGDLVSMISMSYVVLRLSNVRSWTN